MNKKLVITILMFLVAPHILTAAPHPTKAENPRESYITNPPHVDYFKDSKEVKIFETFKIYADVHRPYPAPNKFQWLDEDNWELISYPNSAIKLLHKQSIAPDGCGNDLLQHWELKALKAGTYELIFKRYEQYAIVKVYVYPQY